MNKGRIIVVSGPSGAGKTTLLKKLLNQYSSKISFSVSTTSRPKRKGETEGIDYHFVSAEQFEKDLEQNFFFEYAKVHDNYYGTLKSEIKKITDSGKDCLLDIDVQGGMNLINQKINAVYIFIAPPSVDELKKRLMNRNTDSKEVIEKRVKNAIHEMTYKKKYDYIIVNDNVNKAYNELVSILYKEN